MKRLKLLPASLLLLWTLTASVSCNDASKTTPEIQVKTISDGIELTCDSNGFRNEQGKPVKSLKLKYGDDNSGEYACVALDSDTTSHEGHSNLPKIYVKFRTCDNCVELDQASITGLVVGNVAATIVIAVAVYLLTSQTRISPTTSHKKSSDRQHLVPNEVSSRPPNDHYQPLKHKGGQRDTYDVLTNRR